MRSPRSPARRRVVAGLAALAAVPGVAPGAQPLEVMTRAIGKGGEPMPVVGLGTWITFNVGNDREARGRSTEVMRAFFDAGGRMIDSSPMYGSSQDVVGEGLQRLAMPNALFSADKVWTPGGGQGREQVERSRRRWQVQRFDLVQVHNLVMWAEHLPMLFAMKAARELRYVGITTSEGRRHADIERLMASQPIDFVQVTYNPLDRDVEARILPLARERGIAVIANRPFREGELTRSLARRSLPSFAADIDCTTYAQLILKFIVSHPTITCVIPATTRVDHVRENLAAARGRMPDEAMRRRIADHLRAL